MTIQQVGPDIKVPMNEFDGKVTYGEKRAAMGMCDNIVSHYVTTNNYLTSVCLAGSDYKNHVQQMAPVVIELAALESRAQVAFLKTHIAER